MGMISIEMKCHFSFMRFVFDSKTPLMRCIHAVAISEDSLRKSNKNKPPNVQFITSIHPSFSLRKQFFPNEENPQPCKNNVINADTNEPAIRRLSGKLHLCQIIRELQDGNGIPGCFETDPGTPEIWKNLSSDPFGQILRPGSISQTCLKVPM